MLHVADSDDEGEDVGTVDVPDDIELSCRCHYHWYGTPMYWGELMVAVMWLVANFFIGNA